MRESELIGKISTLGGHRNVSRKVRLGIGDDAAIFRPTAGHETLLTCDWLLEGVHFLREKHPANSVGWKCLARAVSDIAAMGGVPRCFLLSLALPTSHTGRWLGELLEGLRRASRRFHCVLAGGDTTHRNEMLINVMVVGEAQTGCAGLRSGARPGDLVYVSGRLGEAELGLQLLKRSLHRASSKDPYMKKHLYPEPRLALGQWLVKKQLASAMMDLSDGLSSDLSRLCAASAVGARLEASRIPVARASNSARGDEASALRLALHGGDDYELLFTVPRKRANSLPRSFRGLPLAKIGIITSGKKMVLVNENGREQRLDPGGWDPFTA